MVLMIYLAFGLVFVFSVDVKCFEDIEDKFDRIVLNSENFTTIYNQNNGTIKFDNKTNTLLLSCNSTSAISDVIPPFETIMTVKQLLIQTCVLPVKPLVEVLQALNIKPTTIKMLQLSIASQTPLPPGNYMQGLSVQSLWIDARYSRSSNILLDNPDFLKPLSNLTNLIVWGSKLPSLPEDVMLEVLSLGYNAWIQDWEKCEHLQELRLQNISYDNIPEKWPANCSHLTSIRLKDLTKVAGEKLVSSISEGCRNLSNLFIQSCNQIKLPYDILNIAKDLIHLSLTRNRFIDQSFSDFPVMRNLTDLDLSNNYLTGWFITELVDKIPKLRNFNLSGNKFTNLFCDYEERSQSLSSLPSLEWLSLNEMPLRPRCFIDHTFPSLKYLGIASPENSAYFALRDLPYTNSPHLVVDLRGSVMHLDFFFMDGYEAALRGDPSGFWRPYYGKVYNHTNITLLFTYLDCECNNYWLARVLRESDQNFVTVPGVHCERSKLEFKDEPLENMDCFKTTWRDCDLKILGAIDTAKHQENLATADCHGFKDGSDWGIPSQRRIIGLNFSDGSVSSISRIAPMPDSIQWVDLRNNNISRLNNSDLALLFSNPERRVWLDGNNILCDCANKPLLDALHEHHEQVVDFDDLICIESGTPLPLVTSYDVCQVRLQIVVGNISVLIVLLLVLAILFWRYRARVRIYLYSRGWCLFCLREDDDEDRPYDAFLSFVHGDDEYVMEQLLPRLEGEPDFYRICIHYRDWAVGDWIPSQIMRSVQESKRTIIVLSRNFLGSIWGSLEFRYAVASAAQDGRPRLLVIVIDDVLSENLSAELQGYLSVNTYLHCDDPWFWDKLRYVMPHRGKSPRNRVAAPHISEVMNSMQLNSLH